MQAAENINISSSESPMKLTIERSEILKAVGHVQSVVERRGTIPILANIKLEAADGKLELTATDMDIVVSENVGANIESQGATTLPAQMLYDIVRKLPDGADVYLEELPEENKVTISSGNSKFSLPTLPVAEFPVMTEGELSHSFVLSGDECRMLMDKVRFSMSTTDNRYYLNGVYFHATETGDDATPVLRSVATDGHRLASQEVPLPAGAAGMNGAIIPRKTIGELCKLIEEGIEEVKISLSDNKIRFVCGSAILISKLIDGNFPDYNRVIPQNNELVVEVNADNFAKAVDRVSVISANKANGIKVEISAGKIDLSASGGEQGYAKETIETDYSGEDISIGFNARYLIDALNHIEGDNVQLLLGQDSSPALIKDTANSGSLYVIMPMHV